MKILLGGAQEIGKRDDQQDAFYISTPVFGHTEKVDRDLLVLCDGIGGASFGKEAVQIGCDTFKVLLMTDRFNKSKVRLETFTKEISDKQVRQATSEAFLD